MNFADRFLGALGERNPSEAVVTADRVESYENLKQRILGYAQAIRGFGLEGERVGLYLPSCIEYVGIYHATLLSGNVVVPLNPGYKKELRYILEDSDTRLVATTDGLSDRVEEQAAHVDSVENVTTISDFDVPSVPDRHDVAVERSVAVQPYTSGTTGDPKGVLLTHDHLNSLTQLITKHFEQYRDNPKVLAALPLFHTYGMTMCLNVPLFNGGKIHLVSEWDPENVRDTIRSEEIEIFPGVPTMYQDLLELPSLTPRDLSPLQLCISRGSKLPDDVVQEYHETYETLILEGYGMTETTRNPIHNTRDAYKLTTLGKELTPGTVRIVAEDGEPVETGEVGEVQLHSSIVMGEYYERPEETENAFTSDGWFKTDDLMKQDEEGFYHFIGRKDDVIVTGGYNVYPQEVESVIDDLHGVETSVVIGVSDGRRGQTIKAFIVPEDHENAIDAERVKDECLDQLAAYKHPREVEIRETLPRTSLGKVKRERLT